MNQTKPSQAPPKATVTNFEAIKLQLGTNQVSEDQAARIKELTDASVAFAQAIFKTTRMSSDQTSSLRKLREIKYTLTNCIATEEFLLGAQK